MRSISSLPTIEQANYKKLLTQLQVLDPELFMFKLVCMETNLSPMLAERLYRELQNIDQGGGYGKVQVHMQDHKVTDMESTRKHKTQEAVDLEQAIYVTSEFITVVETREEKKQ